MIQLTHGQHNSHDLTQTSAPPPSSVKYVNIGFTHSGQRDYIARLSAIIWNSLMSLLSAYQRLIQCDVVLSSNMVHCESKMAANLYFSRTKLHPELIYIVVINRSCLFERVNSVLYRKHAGISAQRLSHFLCDHSHSPLSRTQHRASSNKPTL
jgi:hypothetical protein